MLTIIRTICTVTRTIQQDSNKHFKDLKLNRNLFIYIIRICEQPGMFLSQVADTIQIDRTTSFRTIKKLTQEGYFELRDDGDNHKIKRLFPTQKALDLYPQLNAYEQSQSDFLLSDLSEKEKQQLALLLSKLKY